MNEAFIIDNIKRDELVEKCSKSAEIIRPILRGRDIKKYKADWADLWLIYIPWHFPLHNNPNIKGASLDAENEFISQYPEIYNHLLKYKEALSNRNRAETGIRYEWYALQRYGANYMEDFSKHKIVWKIIGDQMAFFIDTNNYMVNNACYILTGDNLKYLVAILNSPVIKWYSYLTNMNKTGVGDMQVGAQNVALFPVPILSNHEVSIINLVDSILDEKTAKSDVIRFENEIEKLIYKTYDLTSEEIIYIQNSGKF